jgi:hypothetical protein
MNTHKQIEQIAATDELLDQAIALTPPSANPKTSTTSNAANNNAPSATT